MDGGVGVRRGHDQGAQDGATAVHHLVRGTLSLRAPKEITKPILERYQRHLFYYRKADGRPMTLGTQFGCLAPLKTFFK